MLKKFTKKEQKELNEQLFDAVWHDDLPAVKTAVEAGADVNAKDKNGEAVLHVSVSSSSSIEILKYILQIGAELNVQNNNGDTPLNMVVFRRYFSKFSFTEAQLLLSYGADMYIKNNKGQTPYVISMIDDCQDIVELLISHGYVSSKEELQLIADTKLFDAAGCNDLTAIDEAIKAGADVNAKNMYGECILYKADVLNVKTIKYFLRLGTNPNLQNNKGDTPLHKTVTYGQINRTKLFLKYKADMYIKNNNGYTPFDLSLNYNDYNMAELFISHGYVPSEESMQKIKNNRLLNIIEDKDISAVIKAVEDGADVNAQDRCGYSALLKCVINKDITITEYLLKMGANPNFQSRSGRGTALHEVAYYGHDKAKLIVKLLLKYGADMYFKNGFKKTPFAKALTCKKYDIAELFVLNGYVPLDEDFNSIINLTERETVQTRFMTLASQVQEHKKRLTEETKAMEFAYADEIIEM